MKRLRVAGFAVVVLAIASILAAPATAHHSFPATYTGTVSAGGTVEFDVSADGSSVTRFKIANVPTECGTITSELMGNVAITNHAFDHPSYPLRFGGSFPSNQTAQGTLGYRSFYPSCTSSTFNWTATTTAPPPPAADKVPPVVALGGSSSQRIGRRNYFVVDVACSAEPCRAVAGGTVSVPLLATLYRLRSVSASIAKGARARFKLKLSARALAAARRALRAGLRVKANVKVTASDAAGNKTIKKRTVRLKL